MWVTREVAAPAARAWDVLTDVRAWPRWGPSVTAVDHDGDHIGPTSTGRLRGPIPGLWVPFRVNAFTDGARWDWWVAGVPATGHRVEPLSDDRCRVGMRVPTAVAPYAAVCRVALQRIAALAEAA